MGSISSQCHTVLLYSVLPLEPLYPNLSGLSLSLVPRVLHSRSLNLELPELFVRLLTPSCSCSRSLPHARARSLSLDLELLSRSLAPSLSLISPVLLLSLTLVRAVCEHPPCLHHPGPTPGVSSTADPPNPPSERATGQQEYADSSTADLGMTHGEPYQHTQRVSGSAIPSCHACIDDFCIIRGPPQASHRQTVYAPNPP